MASDLVPCRRVPDPRRSGHYIWEPVVIGEVVPRRLPVARLKAGSSVIYQEDWQRIVEHLQEGMAE